MFRIEIRGYTDQVEQSKYTFDGNDLEAMLVDIRQWARDSENYDTDFIWAMKGTLDEDDEDEL